MKRNNLREKILLIYIVTWTELHYSAHFQSFVWMYFYSNHNNVSKFDSLLISFFVFSKFCSLVFLSLILERIVFLFLTIKLKVQMCILRLHLDWQATLSLNHDVEACWVCMPVKGMTFNRVVARKFVHEKYRNGYRSARLRVRSVIQCQACAHESPYQVRSR